MSISNSPSRLKACPKRWSPMPFKKTPADAELRHARRVGRHHRRNRLGRSGADSALHRRWRTDGDAGQRQHAAARRRAGALRAALVGRRAAQCRRRWRSLVGGRAASGHAHSGRACARHLRSPRPSALPTDIPRTLGSSGRIFRCTTSPRRWLRMAYCTTCLDGPEDRSGVVMEWGDREHKRLLW